MIHETTFNHEVMELLAGSEGHCLSIIIPTHREGSEKKVDLTVIKKYTEQARRLLVENFGKKESLPLLEKLEFALENLDVDHQQEGLGIFISSTLQNIIRFPFPVEAKITAGPNFEIRDVMYKSGLALPYYVLVLTEKGARYFEGMLSELHEIRNGDFPEKHVDDYLYEKPSRSTSYAGYAHEKSMEKDKSILEELRLKNFFHHVDQLLQRYLLPSTPLFVFGTKEILGLFKEVSRHQMNVKGTVHGSYGTAPIPQLASMAWNQMQHYLEQKHMAYLEDFEESIGQGKGISGVQTIWNAVQEGRGRILLVEKDYKCPGFVSFDNDALFLFTPQAPHRSIPDVIDDTIEKMMEKNGDVIIMKNGQLEDYGRMALISRY
ncbi:MAG TPA: hypothetical protein VFV79_09320 [Saprospiraceae bacterium]|nr:hypothetical protein [Saprospiraceae bacterium]